MGVYMKTNNIKVTAEHLFPFLMGDVKNGFSNLTKVQIGQDQYRKDIMNHHQEKALKVGCCERE